MTKLEENIIESDIKATNSMNTVQDISVIIICGKYYIFYYISIVKDEQDIYDGIHYSKFSISQSRR